MEMNPPKKAKLGQTDSICHVLKFNIRLICTIGSKFLITINNEPMAEIRVNEDDTIDEVCSRTGVTPFSVTCGGRRVIDLAVMSSLPNNCLVITEHIVYYQYNNEPVCKYKQKANDELIDLFRKLGVPCLVVYQGNRYNQEYQPLEEIQTENNLLKIVECICQFKVEDEPVQ